jgi:hypothetical protein
VPLKGLLVAVVLGGAGGLALGQQPVRHGVDRQALMGEATAALTGDLQTADLDRALGAVGHLLEDTADDWEAQLLRSKLWHQKRCRARFEEAEHLLAVHACGAARDTFRTLKSDCRLYEFAQLRAAEIQAELDLEPWTDTSTLGCARLSKIFTR